MGYTNDQLNAIYERTDGRCHLCSKKLAFINYGRPRARAAWEVEHSRPRARGGTDTPGNRYAACIPCNRGKGAGSTRTVRAYNGRTFAPLSTQRRSEERETNSLVAGIGGASLGHAVAGKAGAWIGGLAAAHFGYKHNPDRR